MQIFFANIFADENTLFLSAEESKHCVKVLRHKNGDIINLIDGKGNFYEAEITDANPQKCIAQIIRKKPTREPKPYRLHLAISPTKNADRIEWMLEKCTKSFEIVLYEWFAIPRICVRKSLSNVLRNCFHCFDLELRSATVNYTSESIGTSGQSRRGSGLGILFRC
ncbi:MAG: RsmE family RNA methyltransferase [Bacteroidia bacterium]